MPVKELRCFMNIKLVSGCSSSDGVYVFTCGKYLDVPAVLSSLSSSSSVHRADIVIRNVTISTKKYDKKKKWKSKKDFSMYVLLELWL